MKRRREAGRLGERWEEEHEALRWETQGLDLIVATFLP